MGVIKRLDQLEKRYTSYSCPSGTYYGNDGYCYTSTWNAYGRWILLAVVVVGAFLIFLLFSCITARRRRRMGRQPYPLTGWASRPPPGGPTGGPAYSGQQPYYNNQGGYNQGGGYGVQQQQPAAGYGAPPPAYGQQGGGYGGGPQQPQNVYQGARGMEGTGVYGAEGQEVGKKDNVVR